MILKKKNSRSSSLRTHTDNQNIRTRDSRESRFYVNIDYEAKSKQLEEKKKQKINASKRGSVSREEAKLSGRGGGEDENAIFSLIKVKLNCHRFFISRIPETSFIFISKLILMIFCSENFHGSPSEKSCDLFLNVQLFEYIFFSFCF